MASKLLKIKDIFDGKLIGKDGTVQVEDIVSDFLGLYFSAHWCPPCRGFTPVLKEFYGSPLNSQQKKKLEIVFVSSDRDEVSFQGYFKEMPWIALTYEDRNTQDILAHMYEITGIPTLVILDKDGKLITKEGRHDVIKIKETGKIPWETAAV